MYSGSILIDGKSLAGARGNHEPNRGPGSRTHQTGSGRNAMRLVLSFLIGQSEEAPYLHRGCGRLFVQELWSRGGVIVSYPL